MILFSCFCQVTVIANVVTWVVFHLLGGLTFLILWFFGLWVWSVPILLVEYGVGRYTRKTVIQAFRYMAGPHFQWMGGFVAFVVLGIGYGPCVHFSSWTKGVFELAHECTFYAHWLRLYSLTPTSESIEPVHIMRWIESGLKLHWVRIAFLPLRTGSDRYALIMWQGCTHANWVPLWTYSTWLRTDEESSPRLRLVSALACSLLFHQGHSESGCRSKVLNLWLHDRLFIYAYLPRKWYVQPGTLK